MTSPAFNSAARSVFDPITEDDVFSFQATAAHGSKNRLCDALNQFGPDILHARDRDGRTALMKAAETCHTPTMQLMLARGAEIDARDNKGNTALMIAAYKGYKTAVQWLLDNGADINARNKAGQSVLMLAGLHDDNHDKKHPISFKKKETVELVLARGADLDAKNERGQTAEKLAEVLNHRDVAGLITRERAAREQRQRDYDAAVNAVVHSITTSGTAQRIPAKVVKFKRNSP